MTVAAKVPNGRAVGWIEGYKKGFILIRGVGRKEEDFEGLSSTNALTGVTLYDSEGKHVVTIISVDRLSDLMTVKYRNGSVEPKKISALGKVRFVRRTG